ncbi:MAG TPA: tetratricopeptide repeat protein [Thermoanaerobaculia bacterium]|nr:tetratricopeptide repeat protein [Thermoanaerobaculia bacterium]
METASLGQANPILTTTTREPGTTRILEAPAGTARYRWLQAEACAAREAGIRTFLLDVRFDEGGPWAGLRDLFGELMTEVRRRPDLQRQYAAELAYVLPALKKELGVRNQTLTDLAPPEEKVRNYPADRAYRVVHGLIDLLTSLKAATDGDRPWLIACDSFDRISHIGRRFFRDLARRRGEQMNLLLLLAVAPGRAAEVEELLPDGAVRVSADLASEDGNPTKDREAALARALDLEVLAASDPDLAEVHAAEILRCFRLAGQDRKVFGWTCRAQEIYNSLGFYEDALVYGHEAWRRYQEFGLSLPDLRWSLFVKLFMSTVGLQRAVEAQELVESSGILHEPMPPARRAQLYYLVSMLYIRYLPERDLARGEELLEQALTDLETAEMPPEEYHFYWVFNRNGLALVRHLQGRYEEAIELCEQGFERLKIHLAAEKHKLHRSVLLYNLAQVYAAIGSLDKSIEYYSAALEMDPAYSEYYNDRGSLYLRLGRLEEAKADYWRAIELSPPYHEVWTNLGQCHRQSGAWLDAVRAYSTAIDLQPANPVALFGRAQALEVLSREEEALADYDRVIELRPDRWDARGCRAVLLYQRGELERSLEDLHRAIALAPTQADLYFNRSIALSDLGLTQEAVADLEEFLRLASSEQERAEAERRLAELRAVVQN